MGGTEDEKQKHNDGEGKEEEKRDEEKVKDKKKKKDDEKGDDGKQDKEDNKEKKGGKEKKKKNPEDKKDPAKLKLKLEKINTKIKDLAAKREEILKLIEEADKIGPTVAPTSNKDDHPTIKQD